MVNIVPVIDAQGQEQAAHTRSAAEAQVMMMLGDFAFSVDTTAYNQLKRDASWNWSEQERIGKQSILQYTGKSGRTVTFSGETHAFFGNGTGATDDLFDIGEQTQPQLLVSGVGDVLGWWVITEFSDETSSFLPGGAPRKKTWTMTIKHYADNLSDI
ncbi:phage tail protein [Mixta calida]|uniref:phage tail protein n=1 Tax=Mixta calida TaxID=665913 RepID=UPI0034D60A5F